MTKIAHYFYTCGHQILLWVDDKGVVHYKTANGDDPVCPITRKPAPYPSAVSIVEGYEGIGLYYRYSLGKLGWGF